MHGRAVSVLPNNYRFSEYLLSLVCSISGACGFVMRSVPALITGVPHHRLLSHLLASHLEILLECLKAWQRRCRWAVHRVDNMQMAKVEQADTFDRYGAPGHIVENRHHRACEFSAMGSQYLANLAGI